MSTEQRTTEFLQIGEAAERTELTQRTLRYYEEKGLLKPPTRMDGGFRLYSEADLERIEQIKQLRDLLGFSLAEIKDMLEAEELKTQLWSEWKRDADSIEKAAKIRQAREVTVEQIALIDQKMKKMASLRDQLAERMARYDARLLQHSEHAAEASRTEK